MLLQVLFYLFTLLITIGESWDSYSQVSGSSSPPYEKTMCFEINWTMILEGKIPADDFRQFDVNLMNEKSEIPLNLCFNSQGNGRINIQVSRKMHLLNQWQVREVVVENPMKIGHNFFIELIRFRDLYALKINNTLVDLIISENDDSERLCKATVYGNVRIKTWEYVPNKDQDLKLLLTRNTSTKIFNPKFAFLAVLLSRFIFHTECL